ncbi:GNAT family N-acetyltransferase [Pseudomonas sp. SA3-5]|uniref:GNAT family N-acetyltransferase n=1 Tax=Pseudomonas aestuarii TaxID=3018340 RepID=A0ABT4XL57_9PSED|nr:GNAT family N-acetyltransferase [Pseudomonas aestuarii]MDA7088905.1 GNAT family N-acetyltransferase [Pseudomonas aestuarii]
MNPLLLAPLTTAQDDAALDLLDRAFAGDPSLSWYLFAERTGFAQRRRAYLAAYQRFHRANGLPTLGAWQAEQLVGATYFSLTNPQPSASSVQAIGQSIRQQCGTDCLARLDQLLEAFDQQLRHHDSARIEFIAVAPDQQGRGIGSLLLSQTLEHLRQHGCLRVALETAEPRNLALYLRHGFSQTGHLTLAGLQQYYLQTGASD